MAIVILSFCAVFLLAASAGLFLTYRDTMLARIQEVINPKPEKKQNLAEKLEKTKSSLGSVMEQFEKMLPKSQAEVSVQQLRMIRAGFRSDQAVKMLFGAKVVVPLLLCLIALVTGLSKLSPFFVFITCLGVGFLGPDFWLGKKIKARQKKIRKALPDVLDLMVVCVEAGLSLDQATMRTAQELKMAQPDLCDELSLVVLELRAGRERSEAWRNLADRTDEEGLRNMVSMLVQSEQLGTSVAKTLRVHAETLRTQRVQYVEEQAAKTSVKLVFPLVLFIFPALFVVTLGPAAILMMDSFKQLLNN
jgi:tight adherence protein C